MDILIFFNQNPALISIIAFPLGLVLVLAVIRQLVFKGLSPKIEAWLNLYLESYRLHTAAEVKIEERLRELVGKIEEMLTHDWDTKQFFSGRIDDAVGRIDKIDGKVDKLMAMLPKRKTDRGDEL